MLINFIAVLESPKILKLYDITSLSGYLPQDIYSMRLRIANSRIAEGVGKEIDVISYLRTVRSQTELFTVTSATLGLSAELPIPDGVYHFSYIINYTIRKDHTFLVYQNVKAATEELLALAEYNVEVGDYQLNYISDSVIDKYDIEKVRYAKTLLDNLEALSQVPNEVQVNNTLDKLEKLLGILKNT